MCSWGWTPPPAERPARATRVVRLDPVGVPKSANGVLLVPGLKFDYEPASPDGPVLSSPLKRVTIDVEFSRTEAELYDLLWVAAGFLKPVAHQEVDALGWN